MIGALVVAAPVRAQQEELPPGVSLETRYSKLGRPLVSVRPFESTPATGPAAEQIASIIESDLRLGDRYQLVRPPSSLTIGPVDYPAWNSLNVVYLVTGEVSETADGHELALTVHDVVYGDVKQQTTYELPEPTSAEFRMAVHRVSDDVVQAISNQPGIAATRIAFVRQNGNGSYDLMMVDSDGEGLQRLWGAPQVYSPAWSPAGDRLAFATFGGDSWELIEREMSSGSMNRLISGSLVQTPVYSPAGDLIFALWVEAQRNAGLELHRWDGSRAHRLTSTTGDNLSPAVAPDGGRIAFHSSRLGRQHIFVMPADGGDAVLISPLGDQAQFFAPAWSPTGTDVVFHGQSRGGFHLMLADAARPGRRITQLTSQGNNQDPSWAPDGRHIVFTGVGAGGDGLYVIDIVTGETRMLVRGAGLRMPDWSRSLMNGSPRGRASG
ncbi:MAG: hypothetical protein ACREM1_21265 [Longimicrobiales bacterium]